MFHSNYSANNSILPIHQSSSNNNNPFEDHLMNNFPSHLLDDELFLDTIMPYHPSPVPPPPPPPPPAVNETGKKKVAGKGMRKRKLDGGGSSKRKPGKKDRHSKIVTARGPRDRRMRLSLQIARKFFDLQDMLGFDKASKTIEWLFNKSKGAIKDLSEKSCTTAAAAATATSTIIVSSYSEQSNEGCSDDGINKEKSLCGRMNSNGKNSSKGGIVCKMNEKRKEARARARERTKVKSLKNKECLEMVENPNINNNTLDDDNDDNNNNNINNAVIRVDKVNQLEDQMAGVGIIDNFLATSSSSSMANFMEFPGNRFAESGSVNVGLLQEFAVDYSGYTTSQLQGPNSAFMDKSYNQEF